MAAGVGAIGLLEVIEDPRLGLGAEADAGILDREADPGGGRVGPVDGDADLAGVGELHRVGHQVRQDLAQPGGVARHRALDPGAHVDGEAQALAPSLQQEGGGGGADGASEVEGLDQHVDLAGLQPRQVHDVREQRLERDAGAADGLDHLTLALVQRGMGEDVGDAEDAVQRRAQLVADGGEELALGAVGGLCGVTGLGKHLVGPVEIGDVHHHGHKAAVAGAPSLGANPALAVLVLVGAQPVPRRHTRLDPGRCVAEGFWMSPGVDVLLEQLAERHSRTQGSGRVDQLGVTAVPDGDAVVGIEICDALGHRFDGVLQVGDGGLAAPALQHHQAASQEEDQRGRAGHSAGQGSVGEEVRRHGEARIGNQRHRAHGGEVQAADGDGVEAAGQDDGFQRSAGHGDRCGAKAGADDQGGDDITLVPDQPGGWVVGRHAREVHQTDAEAGDHACRGHPQLAADDGGEAEAEAGAQDRQQERAQGAPEVVAALHHRCVGQHGDEVGGPDAGAGGQGGEHQPGQPFAERTADSLGIEPERRKRGGDAGERRNQDQPQVMLTSDARQHLEHDTCSPRGDGIR